MQRILAPIDGSDTSYRALEFAADLAVQYGATLDVVHITDSAENEATRQILERANEVLAAFDLEVTPQVSTDLGLDFRPSNRIGEDVLSLVEEGDYDHVVMGHHGSGALDRAILGSATETVVRSDRVTVTIVP